MAPRLFRALMYAFPRRFREAFGGGVLGAMRSEYARARRRGRGPATRFAIVASWDLLRSGVSERIRPSWNPSAAHPHRWEFGMMLEQWWRDLGHAARALTRSPGFAVVTIMTLSLGIGANVAVFSIVNAVLLEPLPYMHPDRLVSIRSTAPGHDFPPEFNVSAEFFPQYREHGDLLEDVAIYNNFGSTLRTPDFSVRTRMAVVSASFFTTLGVTPMLGRVPGPDDRDDVVVVGHAAWINHFGADSTIVGRRIDVADAMRTVIGVIGPELRLPEEGTSVWIPYVEPETVAPGRFFWRMIGRARAGVHPDDLVAQLAPLAERLPERFGGSAGYARLMSYYRPLVRPLRQEILGDVARPLWVLLGTVAAVLLIAAANVANLFMVRTEARQRDLAVRQALGANRRRLIQGQMTEVMLLAAAGGMGGIALAWAGVPGLLRAAPERLPRADAVGVDGTTLLFTAILVVATTLVFGLVPALRFSRANLAAGLREGGRGGAGRTKHLGRSVLVVGQTALALVLLVGSGLLVRSFQALRQVDPGYETRDVFTFQVAPTGDWDGPSLARFHYELMERLSGLPGVQSVGVVRELPLDEGTPGTRFVTEALERSGDPGPLVNFTYTGGDYFRAMGIPLRAGRLFDRSEHERNPGYALVSETAAELLWPGQDPLGQRFRIAGDTTGWETVIGVVGDIHQNDFRESDGALIYFPLSGRPTRAWQVHSPGYVVKSVRAATMAAEVRALARQIDPGAPFYAVHTLESLAAESMMRLSFTMLTLGVAAAMALILGAIGLYGVLSYVVGQRTREIGLRLALGATATQVRRMVVLHGGRLALLGVVVGVGGAVGLTRVLESLLFGIGTFDGVTFVLTSVLMLAVAVLASYIPARRASSVDPIRSLQSE